MTCTETIYSEQVLDYIVSSYIREETLVERYQPTCYSRIGGGGTIVYREENRIDSQTINQFGYGTVPHVYGLMGYEALEAAGVMQIRRQPYLDFYGQGVIVGFVDTGIDFTHEAFRNADGTTRIHSIWDQTIREGGPSQFDYGRVFSEQEINEALKQEQPSSYLPTRDEIGHGTFLAGVAAGNEIPGKEFSGIAPLSQIIVVKCKEAKNSYREYYRIPSKVPCYQENDIMAGIMYILQVAYSLGRPVTICVGMGSNLGNHDGASPLCHLIDINNMAGASIVACAGNEGPAGHHYKITKKEEEIQIDVARASLGFVCELWWQTPGSVSFDVISPGGSSLGLTRAEDGLQRQKRFPIENTNLEIRTGPRAGADEGSSDLIPLRGHEARVCGKLSSPPGRSIRTTICGSLSPNFWKVKRCLPAPIRTRQSANPETPEMQLQFLPTTRSIMPFMRRQAGDSRRMALSNRMSRHRAWKSLALIPVNNTAQ